MSLFNGKRYVILVIKPHEIDYLLNFAKEHNLEILYPDMFEQAKKEKKTLYKIAIDDKSFGGIVSNIVCWHEITLKKDFGVFRYVKDLKTYLKKIDPISR